MRLVVSWLFCAGVACGGGADDADPVGALRAFLDAMDRSAGDTRALEEAYRLLDAAARTDLAARASRAETLSGREFEPWEMLSQGRFRLRFAPAPRGGMKAEVEGDAATVVVTAADGKPRARVPMLREPDGWKVRLDLPPMQSAVRRDAPEGEPAPD